MSYPCIRFIILNKVDTGPKAPAKLTLDLAMDAREWDKLIAD